MIRVASLFLPHFAIERMHRKKQPSRSPSGTPPDFGQAAPVSTFSMVVDDDPGPCSVPRGGWRPGARWAQTELNAKLAPHQRPKLHETDRRSEAARAPFRAASDTKNPMGSPSVSADRLSFPSAMPRLWGPHPRILIARNGQRDIITSACPLALSQGLHAGMSAAQARALVPDLQVDEAQPEVDQAWLDRLALHAARHWSPTVAVDSSHGHGLVLDVTGTTHLFGGEERFCQRLIAFLQRLGFTAKIAVASTWGAAHGLARYSAPQIQILKAGKEAEALAPLPLSALRIAPEVRHLARRFGIENIGDLHAMPRAPVARRLGLKLVERLDQARGFLPEPIIPIRPFEAPEAERRLVEPIATAEAIFQVIGDLVDDLLLQLQRRGLGLRAGILICDRVDQKQQCISLGLARATRDGAHIKRLFSLKLDQIEPSLGIETMRLSARNVEPLEAASLPSDLISPDPAPDIALLVDQLAGRVGDQALFRITALESDVPERAVRAIPPLATPKSWPHFSRPARLLKRPELLSSVIALLPDHPPRRFTWRGTSYRIVAGDGPERIHGEWWRHSREIWSVRDYFKVESEGGERFWIFRRGDAVDEKTGDLSWHMHGFFG